MTIDLLDVLRACSWLNFKRQTCPAKLRTIAGYRVGSTLWHYIDGIYKKQGGASVAAVLGDTRGWKLVILKTGFLLFWGSCDAVAATVCQ